MVVPVVRDQLVQVEVGDDRVDLQPVDLPAEVDGGLDDPVPGGPDDEYGRLLDQRVRQPGVDLVLLGGAVPDRVDGPPVLLGLEGPRLRAAPRDVVADRIWSIVKDRLHPEALGIAETSTP